MSDDGFTPISDLGIKFESQRPPPIGANHFPEKTVPLVVQEFAARCRQLLDRDGHRRPGTDNFVITTMGVPPLWLMRLRGLDNTLLFVSLPGPESDPGMRLQIYEDGNHGLHWDEQQCRQFLPMIRRRLVLEELSEIPEDG